MTKDPSFADLVRRVRAGDSQAASELVGRYEPALRRVIRVRLRDSPLANALESCDICQSVLASFFFRAANGCYILNDPPQLIRLLHTMARNKLADKARQWRAARRGAGRVAGSYDLGQVPSPADPPSQMAAAEELVQAARLHFQPEELRLIDLRRQGLGWAQIAQELEGDPVLLRKRLSRALDRVARELDLEKGSP